MPTIHQLPYKELLLVLQASQIERELGTQSAFGMTSRWLLVATGSDHLMDHVDVTNVTMDNVAVVDTGTEAKVYRRGQ